MFSSPSIPRESLYFSGILTCLGVTVRLSILKSYWVTSEMESVVRTLDARSSDPIYFILCVQLIRGKVEEV